MSTPGTPSSVYSDLPESQASTWAEYHPVTLSADKPSLRTGYLTIAVSVLFVLVGGWATLFSAFFPRTGNWVLDSLAEDTHYKYFFVLLVPTTAYFVIANWVGWQFYRNS
ncbi:hypothetical protein BDW22DRAFT_1433680 [Trametopsis cervina]|nr:hypothetical protein BDW22DRAFT_1433680 [Trametopsis cervina]